LFEIPDPLLDGPAFGVTSLIDPIVSAGDWEKLEMAISEKAAICT